MPQSIAILTGGCLGTLIGLFAGCALGLQMFAHEGLAVWLAVLVGAPSGLIFGAAMGQLCIHLATPRITVDAH